MNLDLNLLSYTSEMKVTNRGGSSFIYDPIRKKDIIMQPEELVRQTILYYFLNIIGISKNLIRVEKGLRVNGLFRRCDIIVYDRNALPLLIVEVKKPAHSVNQKVFNQVAMYNIPLRVPFLMVSNGVDSYVCQCFHDRQSFTFLQEFPSYEHMLLRG